MRDERHRSQANGGNASNGSAITALGFTLVFRGGWSVLPTLAVCSAVGITVGLTAASV